MAQKIIIKNSSVGGRAPQVSDVELGELAINTFDGKLYLKKNDGSESIVEIGGDLVAPVSSVFGRTGDVTAMATDYSAFYAPVVHQHSYTAITDAPWITNISGESIGDLSDVSIGGITVGQALIWTGSSFAPQGVVNDFNGRTGSVVPQASDYAGVYAPITHSHTGSEIDMSMGQLNNVSDSGIAVGQILEWNGSAYVPGDKASGASGVTSFNTRTGAVTPEVGDYSAFYLQDITGEDLGDLSNVNDSGITNGQTLVWNGSSYVPGNASSNVDSVFGRTGAVTAQAGDYSAFYLADITGESVGDLSDVDLTGITNGQVLTWSGSGFVPATPSTGNVTSVFGRTGVVSAQASDYSAFYLADITAESINDLSDVDTSGISNGQILEWNGSNFVAGDKASGASGVTSFNSRTGVVTPEVGDYSAFYLQDITGESIGDLGNVNDSGITNGQVLQWNGSAYVPATISGGGSTTLGGLTDVDDDVTTTANDGDVLTYNDTAGEWQAAPPSGGGGGYEVDYVKLKYNAFGSTFALLPDGLSDGISGVSFSGTFTTITFLPGKPMPVSVLVYSYRDYAGGNGVNWGWKLSNFTNQSATQAVKDGGTSENPILDPTIVQTSSYEMVMDLNQSDWSAQNNQQLFIKFGY